MTALSDRATPATRVRLVYRVDAGAVAVDAGFLNGAPATITNNGAWDRNPLAYVVAPATELVPGGAPGAGVFGIGGSIAGDRSFFTAVDIKTAASLPGSPTWGDVIGAARRIALGGALGLLGIGPAAELDHIELVSGSQAASASAQQQAASAAARTSVNTSAAAQLGATLTTTGRILLLVAVLGAAAYLYVETRKS